VTGPTDQPLTDLRRTLEASLGDAYAFERELGGGGMSRVFVAEDRALQRRVVVKVLRHDMAESVSFDRFRREIQLAAKLQHPHIVPLLASGEVAGTPYFTMPFIEGESLRAHLNTVGELPVNEAVRILRQVAAALSYAHKHGVVHRDIKPDNVMLTDEFALVTDFGVAKALTASAGASGATTSSGLTSLGLAIGTPAYMAPEQAVADPTVDHRADIYSWGVMAYEMLTGWPPFPGMSAQATLAAQAVQKPQPIESKRPGLPPALASLIMHTLEKRPADRPQTAGELLQELDALTSGSIVTQTMLPLRAEPRRFRVPAMVVGALVVVALIAGVLYKRNTFSSSSASSGISSVAVLPLVNVGGDTATEYFSDGMTDELANALGKLPGLRVASRTSTYAFKGKTNLSAADIGKMLHVQALLEGTVRSAGDRLRVSAQLTNVSDGLALWSETYERQPKDVFKVQDDIAESIADALKLKLGAGAATVASTSRGTDNLEAYDLYLRGIYFWNRRGADNLNKAISYYEQASAKDPHFGRALAAMASAYALLPEYTDSPPSDVLQRTRDAASRALAMDSGLAEPHTALGLASVHAWDYETAGNEYRRALALDPRNATAHQWYGELLIRTNRVDLGIAQMRTAVALDPLAPVTESALGYALHFAKRDDEAITEIKKGLEIAPELALAYSVMAFCYLDKNDFPNAVRSMETAVRLEPNLGLRQAQMAYVYGIAGNQARAKEIVTRLEEQTRTSKPHWFPLAIASLGIHDNETAITALEHAVDAHEIGLTNFSLLNEQFLDPLRGTPRFEKVLERMNLSHYEKSVPQR
jgi:eukaryotic-like serine/threonine-protein kinase